MTQIQFKEKNLHLAAKIEFLNSMSKLTALASQVHAKMPGSKAAPKLAQFIDEQIAGTSQMIEEGRTNRPKLVSELNALTNLPKTQPCPKCGEKLKIISEKILCADEAPDNLEFRVAALNTTIKALDEAVNSATQTFNFLTLIKAQVAAIKEKMGTDPDPALKDIHAVQAELAKLEKYRDEQNATIMRRNVLQSKIAETAAMAKSAADAFDKHKAMIASFGEMPTKEDLLAQKAKLYEEIQADAENIQKLKPILSAREEYHRAMTKYAADIANYKALQEKCTAAQADVDACKGDMSAQLTKIAAFERLKQCSDFAASAAIEAVIVQINDNAKKFIDRSFPTEGTSVVIKGTSETKKGDERAKISVEIFHKGAYAKKLANMSGGEKSRLYLAFQLGLSEMYKSPILMSDEGCTGLSDEKEVCLELLKEAAANKLILVIEHLAPESMFDHVINL